MPTPQASPRGVSSHRPALDPSKVSRRVSHPTLKALGLRPLRVYETRHSVAVLHLAAGENPTLISRLLGHSSGELLFRRYAPFVLNTAGGVTY